MVEIYVGATQNRSTNTGGWGVVLVDEEEQLKKHDGSGEGATQPRMILKAAVEGLSKTEQGCEAKILSNNENLVQGIEDSQQRIANRDLWAQLDDLMSSRHVRAEHIAKHKWLGEAQILAREAVRG